MQLSEEEIGKILDAHIRWGAYVVDPEWEPEDLASVVEIRVLGLRSAAHAIAEGEAEKMREGVAWRRDMFIRHGKATFNFEPSGLPATYLVSDMEELAYSGSYLHLENRKLLRHGQLVTVTVSKKEGKDGDG